LPGNLVEAILASIVAMIFLLLYILIQ
jgi:hypothetical protein